jgi:hypothetical protein
MESSELIIMLCLMSAPGKMAVVIFDHPRRAVQERTLEMKREHLAINNLLSLLT